MTIEDIDVAIIGAGTAGLSARAEVARVTDSYRVFDPGSLGTTCARVGCMPSKAFVQAAHDFHRRHAFGRLGIRGADGLSVDGAAVLAETRRLRDGFVDGVLRGIDGWEGAHLVRHAPAFAADGTLHAGGSAWRPRATVVATGTRPVMPDLWRARLGARAMTTDEFFELDRLPRRIAVIGLGAIGLELGQALARLGVEVTGFEPSGNLGGIADPEVQDCVAQAIAAEMRVVASTAEPEPGPEGAVTVRWDGGSVEVDCVLAAMGRRADLDALALDLVGIAPGQDGRPGLDPATLCVPGTRIYFAGDVTGRRAVLHEAADEGRIAGYNAARAEDVAFRRRVPMTITFTDPQIARIGASWDDLADRRADVAVGSAAFTDSGRGRLARSAGGVVRIYAQKATAQLLGVAIAAPEAEHMAHLLARALEDGATLKDILRMPFYHPTHEEVLRAALRAALAETDVDTEALEEIRCKDTPVDAGPDCD